MIMTSNQTKGNDDTLETVVKRVSDTLDADIVLLNAYLLRGIDNKFVRDIREKKQRNNLLLIPITYGGDADVAYRIARCVQDNYKKFVVLVSGYCKSAGTLCVLGAHEVIMCDQGELGPLDVQLLEKDDLDEANSGLVIEEALHALQQKAFDLFEHYLKEIKNQNRRGGRISFKLATEIATNVTVRLFEPIYRQVDPVMIGNVTRSMTIAREYGRRLREKGKNFTDDALDKLVNDYPSHGFVIDSGEAKVLFTNVRAPSDDEDTLARILSPISRQPDKNGPIVEFLSYGLCSPSTEEQDERCDEQTESIRHVENSSDRPRVDIKGADNSGNSQGSETEQIPTAPQGDDASEQSANL